VGEPERENRFRKKLFEWGGGNSHHHTSGGGGGETGLGRKNVKVLAMGERERKSIRRLTLLREKGTKEEYPRLRQT